ncbi:MAG: PQQ-binding-like beta-propeller repeat protein [Candidatus Dormiibacterota bacterium]
MATLALGAAMAACGAPAPTGRASPSPPALRSASFTPSPSTAATLMASWPTYHLNTRRSGNSPNTPHPTSPKVAWERMLDGSVYAEPLDVGGMVIVATENDSLYALNAASGSVIWRTHVGTPVPQSGLPCGDIFPLGITGTPAFDLATQTLFAVAEESGPVHVLYALDAVSGAVRWSRRVDIQIASESPAAVQQRPALMVANGYVYVGFGGLDGDCAQYRGAVVAVPTSNSGPTLQYVVPTAREGAVWASGGPVLGAGGNIFVSTGNGAATANPWDHSDSVLELSPTLDLISAFAPSNWAVDNQHDLDLGSVAPTLLPDGYVFIAGKSGTGYVLRQSSLGGVGGEVTSGPTCGGQMAFGGTSVSADTVYLPCQNGVEAVAVSSSGRFSVQWQTSTGANGPPVLGGGCVWSVDTDSGVLYALAQATGSPIALVSIGGVPHFTSPTLVGSWAFVGTDQGVAAVSGV